MKDVNCLYQFEELKFALKEFYSKVFYSILSKLHVCKMSKYFLHKRSTDEIPLDMIIGVSKKTKKNLELSPIDYLILKLDHKFYNID